jgi:hypothetical protein
MKGADPWNIYPADFATAPSNTYSLFIPFSVVDGSNSGGSSNSGDVAGNSSINYDVNYNTASGPTNLLHIDVSGENVSVSTAASTFGPSLKFYHLLSEDDLPSGSTLPGTLINPTGPGSIQEILAADVNGDRSIDSSLHLGVVLSGIAIPTALMADGEVASVGVDCGAEDAAARTVPEPTSLAMLLPLGFASLRRRRRRSLV